MSWASALGVVFGCLVHRESAPLKVLLDTHAFIWWMEAAERLPQGSLAVVASPDNQVLISAVIAWELTIKVNVGKIKPPVLMGKFSEVVQDQGFIELPITVGHAVLAGLLPGHHRDPFDRMLIAQALAEDIPIVSNDQAFDQYGVRRLW